MESSYKLMATLIIYTDTEISIMSCQGFSEKNILSLLSYLLSQFFDNLYWDRILGRDNLVSYTVENNATILWAMIHIHEVMAVFSKHYIKRHTSITSIFSRFLITAKISEPLQDISQMKRYINILSTKLDCNHGRLTNI